MKQSKIGASLASLVPLLLLGGQAAWAKPAACFTSDDGHYACSFKSTDDAGSFVISAPGHPAITVEIDRPGVAWLFARLGGRNVPLPGPYLRARDDGACWDNRDTGDRVCAW